MPASPADSAIYRGLFSDEDTARLFSDGAEVRAMLLVWGALAKVQGDLGLIPSDAAAFIERSAREVTIDPAALAMGTTANGVPVPALLAAFRKEMQAPAFARYLHWGATSQDVIDTALMLRLRRAMDIWDGHLKGLIGTLGDVAHTHAHTPMAARTYGQAATPTTFGAVVASWGRPLMHHRDRLAELRNGLAVSLAGAAGTLSAMEGRGPAVRAALADALNLRDPGHGWHTDRGPIVEIAAWMAGVTGSLGKMGQDLILSAQSGIAEIAVEGAGVSSTMPQKQNPVGPSVLVALARHVAGMAGVMAGTAVQAQQRDGSAWFVEWLTFPGMAIETGRSLSMADDIAKRLRPDLAAMRRGLDQDNGIILAEAASFMLARHMDRALAQKHVKTLVSEAMEQSIPLERLLVREFPEIDWADGLSGSQVSGTADEDALAFAAAAKAQDAKAETA